MKKVSKKLKTTAVFTSLALSIAGCKTIDSITKSVNESLGSGGGGAAVGAGAFFACKLDSSKSNAQCAAIAAAAGVITYAYLNHQKKKMDEIDGVITANCEAQEKDREAYCVNMTEDAVTFASGRADLNSTTQNTLSKVANVLKESDDTYVYIEGHTDPVGDASYNQALSEKRAIAVREFFKSQGINDDRLFAVGWGEEKPLPIENNSAQRRVELRVEGGEEGEKVTMIW